MISDDSVNLNCETSNKTIAEIVITMFFQGNPFNFFLFWSQGKEDNLAHFYITKHANSVFEFFVPTACKDIILQPILPFA